MHCPLGHLLASNDVCRDTERKEAAADGKINPSTTMGEISPPSPSGGWVCAAPCLGRADVEGWRGLQKMGWGRRASCIHNSWRGDRGDTGPTETWLIQGLGTPLRGGTEQLWDCSCSLLFIPRVTSSLLHQFAPQQHESPISSRGAQSRQEPGGATGTPAWMGAEGDPGGKAGSAPCFPNAVSSLALQRDWQPALLL